MKQIPVCILQNAVVIWSLAALSIAAPLEDETEYNLTEDFLKENVVVELFVPLHQTNNNSKPEGNNITDNTTEYISESPEENNITEKNTKYISESPEGNNIKDKETEYISESLEGNNITDKETEYISESLEGKTITNKETEYISESPEGKNITEKDIKYILESSDENNNTDKRTSDMMAEDIQKTQSYCQQSLGLTYETTTSYGISMSTSEGNANEIKLHSPTMWSVAANNTEAWIWVTFEKEVFVSGFMVRHDLSYGQRALELQVVWGTNCDNFNHTVDNQVQDYTVVFDEASDAPGIITMQIDEPVRTRCLLIYPNGDPDIDQPLAIQLDLLGCGISECRRIQASVSSTTDSLALNFRSEKMITELTFQIAAGENKTGDFNDGLQISASRTCRTFHNVSITKISSQHYLDSISGFMRTQISLKLPRPIRLQCIALTTNKNRSLHQVTGTVSALGCDIWKDSSECGQTNFGMHHKHSRHKRVIDGQSVSRAQWPWLVSLQFDSFHPFRNRTPHDFPHLCGASLISPTWVLSAAHCLSNTSYAGLDEPDKWTAVLGEHALLIEEDTTEKYEVEQIIVHENYSYQIPIRNDIALIKLKEPVPMSSYARAVCLDDVGDIIIGDQCYVTGWGAIYQSQSYGANNVPLQASVPVISTELCRHMYYDLPKDHDARKFALIDEGVVCTLTEGGGSDSCWGDSGGPLLCLRGEHWTQVGITFGGYKCGHKDFPGVYTRIKHHRDWIQTTMEEN